MTDEQQILVKCKPSNWMLKLSEAARLGAQWSDKTSYAFVRWSEDKQVIGTCFFGAAAHAMLGTDATPSAIMFKAECLMLQLDTQLRSQVIYWNDEVGKTREEIADVLAEEGR